MSFINIFTPSIMLILGSQPIKLLILDISANDLSGSPGLLGIVIFLPPIISAIVFTEVSLPLAILKISFFVVCSLSCWHLNGVSRKMVYFVFEFATENYRFVTDQRSERNGHRTRGKYLPTAPE